MRACGGTEGVVACGAGSGTDPADATAAGGAGRCGGAESVLASVERSSGAPALRPPGAPTGGPAVSTLLGCGYHRFIAKHARSPGRIGALHRVKHIGASTGRRHRRVPRTGRCRLRRWRSPAPRSQLLKTILGIVLHALELRFQLLISVLKLLDHAGELAQRTFHPVEPDGQIAGIGLLHSTGLRRLTRLCRLAAIEKVVQKIAGAALVLRQCGTGQKQHGNCGKRRGSR